jgi:hypothetical protein
LGAAGFRHEHHNSRDQECRVNAFLDQYFTLV